MLQRALSELCFNDLNGCFFTGRNLHLGKWMHIQSAGCLKIPCKPSAQPQDPHRAPSLAIAAGTKEAIRLRRFHPDRLSPGKPLRPDPRRAGGNEPPMGGRWSKKYSSNNTRNVPITPTLLPSTRSPSFLGPETPPTETPAQPAPVRPSSAPRPSAGRPGPPAPPSARSAARRSGPRREGGARRWHGPWWHGAES